MRNIRLTVSYDGTSFQGWQIQPNGRTIQAELRDAIEKATGEPSVPTAAGRTDSGVHALGQVVNFHTRSELSAVTLARALNAYLPPAIVVREAIESTPSFDAGRDACGKMYRYVYHDARPPDAFVRPFSWQVRTKLDEGRMREAAAAIVGTHDFRCFETEWPNRASSVRTVRSARVVRLGNGVYLDVEADGFLYNMVRSIAGTLYEVGRGRREPGWVEDVLRAGERGLAGPTAPPRGLFLVRVDYPANGRDEPPPRAETLALTHGEGTPHSC